LGHGCILHKNVEEMVVLLEEMVFPWVLDKAKWFLNEKKMWHVYFLFKKLGLTLFSFPLMTWLRKRSSCTLNHLLLWMVSLDECRRKSSIRKVI
jgi:hypothetical protein